MALISEKYSNLLKEYHQERESFGESKNPESYYLLYYIKKMYLNSFLDYGCGKGGLIKELKDLYPTMEVEGYDPGTVEFEKHPENHYDFVSSIDVLEHIEPEHIDEVLLDIKNLSLNYIYLLICHSPAKKKLPDGRNAHILQKPLDWWLKKLELTMPDFGFAEVTQIVSDRVDLPRKIDSRILLKRK
jgi:SAM-dependent methyltransferase